MWLLVALLALPMALLALRWLHAMSRSRAWSAIVLRALVLALIAGALAGAAAVRTTERLAVIAVVDVSESVRRFAELGLTEDGRRMSAPEAARRWIERASEQMGPDDMVGVVIFDGSRLAVRAPSRSAPTDLNLDVRMTEGANIEEALRFAAAIAPPDTTRRLVLLSDGGQTAGDALRAAQELARAGSPTPIDVAPIRYEVRQETIVESVDAPPQSTEASTVTVRVELRATDEASGVLRLLLDGRPVATEGDAEGRGRPVAFGPGRRVELFRVPLPPGRVHRFEAIYEPDIGPDGAPIGDTIAANNRGEAFTITPGRGAALVIDGVSGGDPAGAGRVLARALERAGLEVDVVSPAAAPGDALSLEAYDLVVLQNVSAAELDRRTQSLLAAYVHDMGGGLVMTGGRDSFGAGGWKGTPVERVLPVLLDLPEQLVQPSAAIMIVIDSSGSMSWRVMGGARTQQDVANEGAALAILSMDKQDLVGVIEFNTTSSVVVPLGPNTNPERSAARVRSIASGGGTNMYPPLRVAGDMLDGVDAQVKHVILLSDGVSVGSPSQGFRYASEMLARGITVSSIAVGDMADAETLAEIARQGGGEFYRVHDPTILPRIFLREIDIVRKPLIREGLFSPVITPSGSALTLGLPRPAPPLGGLVLTQARPAPGVVVAMQTPGGEPVLAHWSVGLGRVAAYTSDAHRWGEQWLGWEGFQQIWTAVARTIARPPASRDFALSVEEEGDELLVRMDATDDEGRPLDLLTVPGVVYAPDGTRQTIRLSQTGPGSYAARVRAPGAGNYVVTLAPRLGDQALSPVVGGVSRATSPGLRRLRSNEALLERVAEASGGRVLRFDRPEEATLFDRSNVRPVRASTPVWPLLVAWCLAFFLLDVGTRRVAWDRLITREVAGELARMASAAAKGRGGNPAATSGAL
ncbi:MAG: VWA domain-containing protein, partial [Phycisphaerales bacterium]